MPGFCEANIASRLLAASPEYSFADPSAPGRLESKAENIECSGRFIRNLQAHVLPHWQLPASCDEYH